MTTTKINNPKGVFLNVISMVLFVLLDSLIKTLVKDFPVAEVIFYRSIVGIPFLIAVAYFTTGFKTFKLVNYKYQFYRSFLGVVGMVFFFNSYKYLPMGNAAGILFSGPIMLTILSMLFLGDKVGKHRMSAIVIGFIGVLFIVRPTSDIFTVYSLLPLSGAFIWSLVILTMRGLSKTDHANSVTLMFSISGTLASGAVIMFTGFTPIKDPYTLVLILGTGVLGVFAQLFMMLAVETCESSIFASSKYISLILSVFAGFVFFGEIPTSYVIVGILFILVSGLYIVYREYVLKKARRNALRY